jgi:hypothetical protein
MPTREELELRKLELEIRDLGRSPWLRPAYIAALLPAILATIGFLTAWMSGYFSDERAKLKRETVQLQSEREAIKRERDHWKINAEFLLRYLQEENEKMRKELGLSPTPSPPASATSSPSN